MTLRLKAEITPDFRRKLHESVNDRLNELEARWSDPVVAIEARHTDVVELMWQVVNAMIDQMVQLSTSEDESDFRRVSATLATLTAMVDGCISINNRLHVLRTSSGGRQ